MHRLDILLDDAVAVGVAAANPRVVMERAGALLSPLLGVDGGTIAAALAAREKLGSTGFGGGIAIPHGRLDGLPGVAAAVMQLAEPIDWNAIDGVPVDLVVVLLAPPDAGAQHLKALAMVSRMMRDRKLVEKLRGARDAHALWALLTGGHREAA